MDFDLAKSVGEYFNLDKREMDSILDEVKGAVSQWRHEAKRIGIPGVQIRLMEAAFRQK